MREEPGRVPRYLDIARLLYGALVAAAALAISSGDGDSRERVLLTTAGSLLVYWLAHIYARVLAERLAKPGGSLLGRLGRAALREAGIIYGGLPAMAAYGLSTVAGATASVAAIAALGTTVCMLGAAGFVAAHRAAVGRIGLAAQTAGASVLGVLIAVLKAFPH